MFRLVALRTSIRPVLSAAPVFRANTALMARRTLFAPTAPLRSMNTDEVHVIWIICIIIFICSFSFFFFFFFFFFFLCVSSFLSVK
jgi:hypothetical protein